MNPTFEESIKARVEALNKRRDELIQIAADGKMTGREIAEGLELFAKMADIRDEITEWIYAGKVKFTQTVTVQLDEQKIKFPHIYNVAEWMVEDVAR